MFWRVNAFSWPWKRLAVARQNISQLYYFLHSPLEAPCVPITVYPCCRLLYSCKEPNHQIIIVDWVAGPSILYYHIYIYSTLNQHATTACIFMKGQHWGTVWAANLEPKVWKNQNDPFSGLQKPYSDKAQAAVMGQTYRRGQSKYVMNSRIIDQHILKAAISDVGQ